MGLIGAGGIVGQRIAGQDRGNAGIDGDHEGIDGTVGVGDGVEAGALGSGGQGHDLGGSEDLAEALVLGEIEGALAAVVGVGNEYRAAVGESELVAAEGRNAAGIDGRGVVEVVAGVEGGVADKLEDRSVESAGAGAGDDIGEPSSAAADFGGHPAGAGCDGFDGIHVEVGEGGAAHLRIGDVGAVHCKGSLDATLAVDGELLGEVGGAVGVGHGAGGQEQKGGEVALVERELTDGLAGELLTAGGDLPLEDGYSEFAAGGEGEGDRGRSRRQVDGLGIFDLVTVGFNGEAVWAGGQRGKAKMAVGGGDGLSRGAVGGEANLGGGNGGAGNVAEHSLPDGLLGLLRPCSRREQKQCGKHESHESLCFAVRL